MAEYCYLCKNKIGFFGSLNAGKKEGQPLCENCVNNLSGMAALYNKKYTDYSLKQLQRIYSQKETWKQYVDEYASIQNKYLTQIQKLSNAIAYEQREIEKVKLENKKNEREDERELARVGKEYRREQASSDSRRILKEYEQAVRNGNETVKNNLEYLMNEDMSNLLQSVEDIKITGEKFRNAGIELIASAEAKVAGYEECSKLLDTFQGLREFVYKELYILDENVILGMPGKAQKVSQKDGIKEFVLSILEDIVGKEASIIWECKRDDYLLANEAELLVDNQEDILLTITRIQASVEEMKHLVIYDELCMDSSVDKDLDIIQSDKAALEHNQNSLERCEEELEEKSNQLHKDILAMPEKIKVKLRKDIVNNLNNLPKWNNITPTEKIVFGEKWKELVERCYPAMKVGYFYFASELEPQINADIGILNRIKLVQKETGERVFAMYTAELLNEEKTTYYLTEKSLIFEVEKSRYEENQNIIEDTGKISIKNIDKISFYNDVGCTNFYIDVSGKILMFPLSGISLEEGKWIVYTVGEFKKLMMCMEVETDEQVKIKMRQQVAEPKRIEGVKKPGEESTCLEEFDDVDKEETEGKYSELQPTNVMEGPENEKTCFCQKCGKENKAIAKFCKFCGTAIELKPAIFCIECGNKIKPGKKFCPACGAKVE